MSDISKPPVASDNSSSYGSASNKSRLIILHDTPSTDLSHIQAKVWSENDTLEEFAWLDYVKITQVNTNKEPRDWIGQIIQPNQNVSIVGGRFDPTILHGLELMQSHPNVQSVESVQIYDILILGEFDGKGLTTLRVRPLPGAIVRKLNSDEISNVVGLPAMEGSGLNVIGELLNADDVPLCVTTRIFNYHFMVCGGTGSGKSNAAANLVRQALRGDKCVLIHDAKPDYGKVNELNTDGEVTSIWKKFQRYGMEPKAADKVARIGFYKCCDPAKVDLVVGFAASDFSPEMLGSFFFTGNSQPEANAFEGFVAATSALAQRFNNGQRVPYSVNDILLEVDARNPVLNQNVDRSIEIHSLTAQSIRRKVTARLRNMPWLDSVGRDSGQARQPRLRRSFDSSDQSGSVAPFDFNMLQPGTLLVIDYSRTDDDQQYALILSYFLRECQKRRKRRYGPGIVHLVDEAHRIFDNESRHSSTLARGFEGVMREGRSVDHSIILSLQNASQIPGRVMNNLNSKIVMRQNSKTEADAATQTMGKDFTERAMRLGTGQALVNFFESRSTVLAQMAPSPYELMRTDNTEQGANVPISNDSEDSFI
jgi:hypothetical protein